MPHPQQRCPFLIPQICKYVTLHDKRNFFRCDYVKDFEMGKLFWIVQLSMTTGVLEKERERRREKIDDQSW